MINYLTSAKAMTAIEVLTKFWKRPVGGSCGGDGPDPELYAGSGRQVFDYCGLVGSLVLVLPRLVAVGDALLYSVLVDGGAARLFWRFPL